MKKQILFGFIAILASSLVFASGDTFQPVAKPDYFSGFYAGLGVGANYVTGNVKNDIVDTEVLYDNNMNQIGGSMVGYSFNENLNAFGFVGDIFGGYGKTFNRFYIGGELFGRGIVNKASESKSQTVIPGLSGKTEIDRNQYYSFGSDIRAGFLVTPRIMIYALAGVDVSQFNYQVKHEGTSAFYGMAPNPSLASDPLAASNEQDFNKIQPGFMPGIGIEAMLTNKLSLRAQYTYTIYGSTSEKYNFINNASYVTDISVPNIITSSSVAVNSSGELKADTISNNAVTVDLTYHFNGIA